MMNQAIRQAITLVEGKTAIVETFADWELLMDEIRGIDEWIRMTRYYSREQEGGARVAIEAVTPLPSGELPPAAEKTEAKSVVEKQAERQEEQEEALPAYMTRRTHTFQRDLQGGHLLEWPDSFVPEREVRHWNLEHGMEVETEVVAEDPYGRTTHQVLRVGQNEDVAPRPDRIVYEGCIVKNHGIIEETLMGPICDEYGKPFYYTVPVEDMRFHNLQAGMVVDLAMWQGRPDTLKIIWRHQKHHQPIPAVYQKKEFAATIEEAVIEQPAAQETPQKKAARYEKLMKRAKPQAKPKRKEKKVRAKKAKEQLVAPLDTTVSAGLHIDEIDKSPLDFEPFAGMRLMIVGNDKQHAVYRDFFDKTEIELQHVSGDCGHGKKVKALAPKTDAIVIIKSRVSHEAANHAIAQAKKLDIPFVVERLDGRRSLYTACCEQLEKARVKRMLAKKKK